MPAIHAVQFDIAWEDKARNFARVEELLAAAPPERGDIVVLPEMFSTGFSLNLAVTRQQEAREDEAFLRQLAIQRGVTVVGGVVSPDESGRGRNQSVAFDASGALLARYTKIHPFSLGGEAEGHIAGDAVAHFAWGGFRVAPFVCYDLRFPELFRAAAKDGAEMFIVIALWPVKRQHHWLTLLQARAIENQAYVIGVNRVGSEPQYQYAGRSVVIDPHGFIIADAAESETVLRANVDPEIVRSWRRDFPALLDAGFGS